MSPTRCRRSTIFGCSPLLRTWLVLLATFVAPAHALDITVDLLGDPVPNGCTPGDCSLREAVNLANSLAGADRIVLPATPSLPLQLSIPGADENGNATGDLDVTDDLEIVGAGINATVLVQTAADRIVQTQMASDRRLILRGLTLQGGESSQGGAVRSQSLLLVEDVAFIGNHSSFEGGAIHHGGSFNPALTEPRLVLRRTRFSDNDATGTGAFIAGGAVYGASSFDDGEYLLIEDSEFSNNEAKSAGGAIYLSGGANIFGGGVIVRRSDFSSNLSGGSGGGALYIGGSHFDLTIEESLFDSNENSGNQPTGAGAVNLERVGSTLIVRSTFLDNSGVRGGALRTERLARIIDSRLMGNSATLAGGAIWGRFDLNIERSTLDSNTVSSASTSDDGGGAIGFGGSTLTIDRSTLTGNQALRGGGVSMIVGRLVMRGATVAAPAFGPAGRQGTALRILDDSLVRNHVVVNSILIGNCLYPTAEVQLNVARGNIEATGSTCRLDTANFSSQNQIGVSTAQVNLGALADNGGPTPTRLPVAPSAAIDQGNEPFCTDPDQRGYSRVDASCDVGAVEAGASVPVLAIFADGFE